MWPRLQRDFWLRAALCAGAVVLGACSTGVNRRSSDCSATVNHCLDRCAGQPEPLEPRNNAIDSNGRAQVAPSSCERSCYRDCQ